MVPLVLGRSVGAGVFLAVSLNKTAQSFTELDYFFHAIVCCDSILPIKSVRQFESLYSLEV